MTDWSRHTNGAQQTGVTVAGVTLCRYKLQLLNRQCKIRCVMTSVTHAMPSEGLLGCDGAGVWTNVAMAPSTLELQRRTALVPSSSHVTMALQPIAEDARTSPSREPTPWCNPGQIRRSYITITPTGLAWGDGAGKEASPGRTLKTPTHEWQAAGPETSAATGRRRIGGSDIPVCCYCSADGALWW
jgi:hypothetical protein